MSNSEKTNTRFPSSQMPGEPRRPRKVVNDWIDRRFDFLTVSMPERRKMPPKSVSPLY